MRRLREVAREWLVPPALWRAGGQLAHRARQLTASRDEAALLARNAQFHGRYRGRRCFVIGNGPSVAGQDLAPLASEITITMNWFNRHPVLDLWRPTFHCIAEPGDAACWQDPGFLPRLLDRLHAQAYFMRLDTRTHVRAAGFPQIDRVHYVKVSERPLKVRSVNLTRPLLPTPDTSILAVMVALALGCSPIYLLGIDYDWLSHRSLYGHFYDADDPVETREDLGRTYYLRNIEAAQRQWRSHELLREIALRGGQRIYNATAGGFLDVYPRATLAETLAAPEDRTTAARREARS